MRYYSNPTADAAIGSVEQEIRRMKKWAKEIRRLRKRRMLTPEYLAYARKQFVGIHARFLREALEDKPEAKRNKEHTGNSENSRCVYID